MVKATHFLTSTLTVLHFVAPGASFETHPSRSARPATAFVFRRRGEAKRSDLGPGNSKRTLPLFSGVGVADKYSWNEEQFEIEVKVACPPGTAAKDVKFKCRSDGVDLRLGDGTVLLDGERKVRGNICVDGTFWSIEGPVEEERTITVTIEKHFLPTSSSGGAQTYDSATQFDWKGVYLNDEDEVSLREYDEPEVLDVREYASKLGVDIDNIDMSKVDKTMFSSKAASGEEESDATNKDGGFRFDIEAETLDQLTRTGLAKEIVQQADGKEYEINDESFGESQFGFLGQDVSIDELAASGLKDTGLQGKVPSVFSEMTVPVEEAPGFEGSMEATADGLMQNDVVEVESSSTTQAVEVEEGESVEVAESMDPIDKLTVSSLKEILRKSGLKVSGRKQELRDRLREYVFNQMSNE